MDIPRASKLDSETHGRSRRALERAFEVAVGQLDSEAELPRRGESTPEGLVEDLGIAIRPGGVPFDDVVERLQRILAATPSSASPRFFNQLFGGRDPISVVAEMLTPLTNTSMYTYKVAGPQVLVEREVLARMCAAAGYPDGEGMMSPGGSLANLTALLIARNEGNADVRERGLSGQRLTVYTSAAGHYSIRKAAGILGIGRDNVRDVPTDGEGRMDAGALERTLTEDRDNGFSPVMINATAGTTVLGAFDPIASLADLAERHDVWLNVDGALGGSVVLSKRHRQLIEGVERADSFAWNIHKMMGVPLSCSALLLSRKGLLNRHLNESADYLFQTEADELNPGTRSLQCGRRNDALKVWAAWQYHGDSGYEERLDRMFDLARYAADRIEADPRMELLIRPASVNVCFEVIGESSEAICDLLDREGRLLVGHGAAMGRRAIRLVCVNPDMTEEEIDVALDEIREAATRL